MKPSIKRALSLLLAAGCVAAAAVVYGVVFVPAYREINTLRGTVSAREDALAAQREIIREAQILIAEYENLQALEETVSLALPRGERLAPAVSHLAAIARMSGVRIEALSVRPRPLRAPSQNAARKNIGTLEIHMKAEGSYEGLRAFFAMLETNVRVMDLETLSLNRTGAAAQNLLTGNAVVTTYYQ